MRGEFQEAMQAMGLAYEHFPMNPEDDPAYPYIRASRYSLYVFGDAQSRLFLGQPKEAEKALIAMQKETNDPQIEPITKLDMLYYQAAIQIQQGELEPGSTILTEAALLAKDLGSRLYFIVDQDRALTFYVETLGFELVTDRTVNHWRWISLLPPGGSCAIGLVAAPDVGIWTGVSLLTSQLDDVYQRWTRRRVAFDGPPTLQAWGTRTVIFSDCDRNRYQLVEVPSSTEQSLI